MQQEVKVQGHSILYQCPNFWDFLYYLVIWYGTLIQFHDPINSYITTGSACCIIIGLLPYCPNIKEHLEEEGNTSPFVATPIALAPVILYCIVNMSSCMA